MKSIAGEVKGRILHVLYKEQIQHLKSLALWPAQFSDSTSVSKEDKTKQTVDDFEYNSSCSDDDEDTKFVNPNHVGVEESSSDKEEYSFWRRSSLVGMYY